ncbi:MAG: hypothetical protein IIV79_01585, partial [Clostridia bacterium]|nr:hypothetical protein [Clostridia bacterium]
MNKKNTKRALLASALSLLLCVSMLVGTTYAWFTDSVTSANNVIQSGTLDVVLEYKTNWADDWAPVDGNTKIFKEGALYEPGYTEVVYLRVSNPGSLALKYLLSFNIENDKKSTNVYGEEFRISDYLYVGTYVQDEYNDSGFNYADILMPVMFGTRESALNNVTLTKLKDAESIICKNAPILPGEDTAQVVAIVLTMPETVGNEANTMPGVEAPSIELGVNLLATQYTHEYDSFNNQYDADAFLGKVHDIHDLATLQKAFEEGGKGRIINMRIEGVSEELAKGKELILNMNTSTLVKEQNSPYAIVNKGDLTITGEGTIRSEMYGSIENHGNLTIDSLNIYVSGGKYGFHVKRGGVTKINNLTLNAQRGGVNVQYGKCEINDADVVFTGYYDNAGKKWLNGYSVYAGGEGCEVVINGGKFSYDGSNNDKGRILCADDNAIIIVNGGTFGKGSTKVSTSWLSVADSNKDGVTGQIFI